MTSQFFFALLSFLVVPNLLSKLFGISKIFPLVFLQLLFGLFIHLSGLGAWLQSVDIDLVKGPLAYSLYGMGWLGISLLIALTGAESAPRERTAQTWRFIPISVIGFSSTCAIGSLIGYGLLGAYPELKGAKGDAWTFCIAVGISLSVTALPVLVAILREIGLSGTALGNLASNAALLDDLWMWLGLAVVLSLVAMGGNPFKMILALAAYLFVMFALLRPLLRRWLDHRPHVGASDRILLSISVIFLSSITTDLIGLHSILGAFVAGAVLPRQALAGWRDPLIHFIQALLLPFFFILTGMRLDINIYDQSFWQITAAVTSAAVISKFLSVAITARFTGLPWPQCFLLGSLMQCKGLMELVAINILLDAGVISAQIFSALAMMALISTFITAPVMQLLIRRGKRLKKSQPQLSK